MNKKSYMNIESYTRIDENAKIAGVALIPRISRNQNLYTKEELKRFDGVTVPLNWEHDGGKVIGEATFHYNAETETVFYEGEITDASAAILAKNRLLYTSIEATPVSVKQVCNGDRDCFHMPFGLKPEGLALTETPGVPETSVSIIEKYIAECNDPEMHKTLKRNEKGELEEVGNPGADDQCLQFQISKLSDAHPEWDHDKVLAVAHSECGVSKENVDNIMQDTVAAQAKAIEEQIENKKEILDIFKKMSDDNQDPIIVDQIEMLENDIQFLTNELLHLRKDSEFISIENNLSDIVQSMKERYLCDCCNEVKKNH